MTDDIDAQIARMVYQTAVLCTQLPDLKPSVAGSTHICSATECFWVGIAGSDVFVCEESGKVHWCTRQLCRSQIEDTGSVICPISARVYQSGTFDQVSAEDLFGSSRDKYRNGGGRYNRASAECRHIAYRALNLFPESAAPGGLVRSQARMAEQKATEVREAIVEAVRFVCFDERNARMKRKHYNEGMTKMKKIILSRFGMKRSRDEPRPVFLPLDVLSMIWVQFKQTLAPYRFVFKEDMPFCEQVVDLAYHWWNIMHDPDNEWILEHSMNRADDEEGTPKQKRRKKTSRVSHALAIGYIMASGHPVEGDIPLDTSREVVIVPKSAKAEAYFPPFHRVRDLIRGTKTLSRDVRLMRAFMTDWTDYIQVKEKRRRLN